MPSTALTILKAERDGISNFSVFCNHITIVPTIKAILDSPDLQLAGFLGPGHVSMVIGTAPFKFIANYYRKPMVIAGFEPLDILQSIWMVLKQIKEGRSDNGFVRGPSPILPRRRYRQTRNLRHDQ
jgi:hydrogenase expression/formation protein HypD